MLEKKGNKIIEFIRTSNDTVETSFKKICSQVRTLTLGVIISNSEDLPRRGAKHFIIKCYR